LEKPRSIRVGNPPPRRSKVVFQRKGYRRRERRSGKRGERAQKSRKKNDQIPSKRGTTPRKMGGEGGQENPNRGQTDRKSPLKKKRCRSEGRTRKTWKNRFQESYLGSNRKGTVGGERGGLSKKKVERGRKRKANTIIKKLGIERPCNCANMDPQDRG